MVLKQHLLLTTLLINHVQLCMYMYLQDPHPFPKHESINESQTKAIISKIFFVNFGHSLGQLGFKVYINKIRQL